MSLPLLAMPALIAKGILTCTMIKETLHLSFLCLPSKDWQVSQVSPTLANQTWKVSFSHSPCTFHACFFLCTFWHKSECWHTDTHHLLFLIAQTQPLELAIIVRNTWNQPTVHPNTDAECFSNSTMELSLVKSFQIVAPHTSLSLPGLYLADLIVIELEIWLN